METTEKMKPFLRNLVIGCLLFSITSLLCFGIVGIGRGDSVSNSDGAVLYAAGRAWLSGLNPYHHPDLVQSVDGMGIDLDGIIFFYPPQSAAICILLALFSYPVAKVIWLLINLAAIAAIIAITSETIRQYTKTSFGRLGSWIMAAVIIGNPFTTHVVWMGQTSLVALATTMAAWFFSQRKSWLLAGICLGIATFKPQFSFLLIIWFLLQKEWKILLTALGSACILSFYPLVKWGPIGMLLAWKSGISEGYGSLIYNTPGFQHNIGLQSLLASAGISIPTLTPIAVILVVLLWIFRNRIETKYVFGILMTFTLTFVGYSHDYDYVFLIPVLTSLLLCAYSVPKTWLVTIPLVALLFVPQRFFRVLEIPVLNHWRTVIVFIFMVILISFSFINGKRVRNYS